MRKTSFCTKNRLTLKIWSDGSSSWNFSLGGKGYESISKQDLFIGVLWQNKNKKISYSKQNRVTKFQRKYNY
jgi:hypothetical protein